MGHYLTAEGDAGMWVEIVVMSVCMGGVTFAVGLSLWGLWKDRRNRHDPADGE